LPTKGCRSIGRSACVAITTSSTIGAVTGRTSIRTPDGFRTLCDFPQGIYHALLSYSSQGRRQQDDPELFRRKNGRAVALAHKNCTSPRSSTPGGAVRPPVCRAPSCQSPRRTGVLPRTERSTARARAYFEDARLTKISGFENCAGQYASRSTSVAMMAMLQRRRKLRRERITGATSMTACNPRFSAILWKCGRRSRRRCESVYTAALLGAKPEPACFKPHLH